MAAADEPVRGWGRLVGVSSAIQRIREVGARVAPTPATVLITGESGSGKEVVARALHESSDRAGGPFVAINCAAIPGELLEAELFGYEAGAFTGAVRAHAGQFEEAHGGTLFLDEVTELSVARQAKLLRALQERMVQRLGRTRAVPLDVRIVAASNRDPRQAVRSGLLRQDLYYRLRVVEISLPPLRERTEDVLPLVLHFFDQVCCSVCHHFRSVSVAALEAMEAYPWPGNVRELENVVARAAALTPPEDGDELLPRHLPAEVLRAGGYPEPDVPPDPVHSLNLAAATHRVRQRCLCEALRLAHGNRTGAARLLGISRRALYDLLHEYPAAEQDLAAGPSVPHPPHGT